MKVAAWGLGILFTIAASLECAAASGIFGDTSFWEAVRLQVGYTFALFQTGALNMIDNFAIRQAQIEHLENMTQKGK